MPEQGYGRKKLYELAQINPESLPANTPAGSRFHYIDLSTAKAGIIDWSAVSGVSRGNAPSRAQRIVRTRDVLFGTVRPNLQSHGFIDKDAEIPLVASTGFAVVRAIHGVSDPDFLFHSLMGAGVAKQAERQAVGSNYPAVNDGHVRDFTICTPPYEEQTVIARVLNTLDFAIRRKRLMIGKLKQVKQGLLHDLLTRGIDSNGELRPSFSLASQIYTASPFGVMPKTWQLCSINSIAASVTSGSRDWARFYAKDGAIFVRIGNLTRDHINLRCDSVIYVRPPANGDGSRTRLEPSDLLLSITADLGMVAVIPEDVGEAYINQHIALVRLRHDLVNARFVGHFLQSTPAQRYIASLNDAGAKAGLNLPTVRAIEVALPTSRDEQDEIARRLDASDEGIKLAKGELEKLKLLKSGLMDDLLTGRVRVTSLLNK